MMNVENVIAMVNMARLPFGREQIKLFFPIRRHIKTIVAYLNRIKGGRLPVGIIQVTKINIVA
ncbi:MAG: hypothetical protein BV459_09160 [Thermoplasmata archaeon M11B2D]|nr:MAG: hypothetical protein BV459_09160 [Thermoplasmata archaeon M11B2D]